MLLNYLWPRTRFELIEVTFSPVSAAFSLAHCFCSSQSCLTKETSLDIASSHNVRYLAASAFAASKAALVNPIIASVVLYLIWLPVDALLLSWFGTTPAKWLFGIRVAHPGGDLLTFSEALKRSFLVFVQGVGFGIPFVALFTQLFGYRRLTKTGTTLWDTSANAVVFHKKWGVFRALACTAAVIAVLVLISALNAAGK